MRHKETTGLFRAGYSEMMRKLRPTLVICLSVTDKCDTIGLEGNVRYINVSTFTHKPIRR